MVSFARSVRTGGDRASPGTRRTPLAVGTVLAGKYRVERVLGEGGMGLVVEAHHELLDQRVAVKLLYGDGADREAESRLLLEARAAAKLQSDHVARVIDVDVGPDGRPFIVMELLEGADLCQLVDARGALPGWMVVDYILQALEGLAHAHGRGIVHRDLKPSNLFLTKRTDGTEVIKILDFGISKSQNGAVDRRGAQLTGGRAVLGSPPYMSPEQVRRPKSVDHRTDIWSLGVCMYELLTNSMPFGGEQLQETFAQILETQPTPIRSLVGGVPEGLEQVVMTCLAKDRDARFRDVAELAGALAPFGSGAQPDAAERVQAALARAFHDEAVSVSRMKSASVSNDPSAPVSVRRLDLQPELNGTAATVARGLSAFDKRRGWIIGLAAASAVGLAGIVGVVYVRSSGAASAVSVQAPKEPPLPASVEVLAVERPAEAVRVDALPVASTTSTAAVTTTSATASAPKARPARRVALPASTPRPTSAKGAKPSLPAGLPLNRSGQ